MAAELATTLATTEAERLEQAEGLVRDFCGWHIAPARTESLTVNGSGSAVLVLPSLHVTAVTAVTDDGTVVDVADYDWDAAGIITGRYWRWGTRKVVVDLTHGYDTVPPAVSAIVKAVAQRAFDNPGSRPRDQKGPFAESFSQVGFNQAPTLALLDAEKEALSHYKLPPRP